jgi:basic amino acid/polyamine antiporter, APA family
MNTPGQLPRVLGFFTASAIVVGTVIGSGVFKKASAVAENVPQSGLALLAWIVVGVLTLMGALILAEVAVIVGKAGGNYAILRDSYGRMAGFLFGWVEFWIIRSASIAALATIFADSVHDILKHYHPDGPNVQVLSPVQLAGMTATVIAVLAAVNARGTKLGGGLQLAITLVKVSSLVLIAILPFIMVALSSSPEAKPDTARLQPIWPSDGFPWVAFGSAMVGVFWAYNGWMNIAPMAEEIKNPQRNLPFALLAGVGLLIAMYVGANLAYLLIIPANEIVELKGRTVAGEFSFRILGHVGLLFASAAIMISVFGALNGNLLVGPRLLFAMGQDGLAPRGLSRLHPRYATPARAELVLAGWSILLVLAVAFLTTNRLQTCEIGSRTIDMNLPEGKDPFDVITDFAMFGSLSFETLAVASIFVLRRRFPVATVKLAYRCPLYPWLPIVFVVCQGAVLVNMFRTQETEAKTGLGFILVGAIVYLLFGRRHRSQRR